MPNSNTVRKRIKTINKRTLRNKSRKSAIKTFEKKFKLDIENKKFDDAQKSLIKVISNYDKAVKAGIIHKNLANRKKSRLTLHLNKVASSTK